MFAAFLQKRHIKDRLLLLTIVSIFLFRIVFPGYICEWCSINSPIPLENSNSGLWWM